jgi:ATP-dependent Lhr-like helicase
VGQVSRGCFQPSHSHDILEAAVLARAVMDGDLEEVRPVRGSLDVLAQVLVSMLCTREWDLNELYARVRCAWCLQELSHRQFDLVIDMLAGCYAETRVRELKARISVDRITGTARIVKGAQMALFLSGGTIPDRGYFHLRTMNGAARLGDLDEEFVWEARVGDVFTMGAQNWRIDRITHDDVLVSLGRPGQLAPPFWKAELSGRDHHLSTRMAEFLEQAEGRFKEPGFWDELGQRYLLDESALTGLKRMLEEQREGAGKPLPHRHHLLVELVQAGPQGGPGYQAVLHTVWGGRVNRPYALALQAAWEERYGVRLEIFAANDCIYLILPHEIEAGELLSLVSRANLEPLLRRRLEGSGIFGAQFRECAGRALLLSRRKFNERMPLWLNRLRGKKLLGAVKDYGDFPIMLEAWRACLHDEFDLDALKMHLAELETGAIEVSQARTGRMSPLARTMAWRLTNLYMYEDDTPEGMGKTGLSDDLLSEAVFNPGLRSKLEPGIVRGFLAKRQRLHRGYAPESPDELWDWLVERQTLPLAEWENLLGAMERDSGLLPSELEAELSSRLVRLIPPRADEPLIAAWQETPRLLAAWRQAGETCTIAPLAEGAAPPQAKPPEPEKTEAALENFLGHWLSYYGPLNPQAIAGVLGMGLEHLEPALQGLAEAKSLISGELVEGTGGAQVCDAQNFEICLRMARARARPAFEPLALKWLPVWLAQHQGLLRTDDAEEALAPALERLVCLCAPARAWEEDILPARAKGYRRVWLDRILAENDLLWLGRAKQKVLFCFGDDLDLLPSGDNTPEPDPAALFPDPQARYDLTTLMENSSLGASRIIRRLWQGVWAGRVSNTSFAALRQGIENRFKPPKLAAAPYPCRGARPRLRRFKAGLPLAGDWLLVPKAAPAADPLEQDECARERVRILLERYGVIFRELLNKEAPGFNWREVFRSLRLMELSGEVVAGYFFEGVSGPQFALSQILPRLNSLKHEASVFWLAATDPASACGLGLEGLKGILPRRAAGIHLVFRGAEPVLVSYRSDKELRISVPPDDPDLSVILAPVQHLVSRRVNPVRGLKLEIINGQPAAQSPYLEALKASFSITMDYKGIMLYPKQP